MIISMDVEYASDKTQHSFMIKTLNKLSTERANLNKMKVINDKPTDDIIFSS